MLKSFGFEHIITFFLTFAQIINKVGTHFNTGIYTIENN